MGPLLDADGRPSLWKRFAIGAALIVFATAATTAIAAFREVDKVVNALNEGETLAGATKLVAKTDPGKPQTLMLLGSDRRPKNATDGGAGSGARSDTIILVRLDPDKDAIAMMSLPRDLRVQIPGHGVDKINAAYELGGPALTLKTVSQLTGLSVNHVINVDFRGFSRAVDAIGCIYADIDRRYYNDSPGYAYIDIKQGYQKLCGEEALEFARFRHEDSDLVRGARQQALLRDAKAQVGTGKLIEDREKLLRIFGKYTSTDAQLKTRKGILQLLELAVFSAGQSVQEVSFAGKVGITSGDAATGVPSYVTASDATVKELARQFLGVEDTPGPRGELLPKGEKKKKKKRARGEPDGGLEKAPGPGKEQAVQAIAQGAGGLLPVYYPTIRLKRSLFAGPPRYYKILTPEGKRRKSYRMVIKRHLVGEYYGLQGTTWEDPPTLRGDHDERKIGKRTFEIHYDGDRVRLVAWRTPKAVYWVSNTLLQTLSERQMIAIARTARLP